MASTNNEGWIQKAECKVICFRYKTNFGESCGFHTEIVARNLTELLNPKEFHMLWGVVGGFSTNVQDLGMEYPKNTGIPKKVSICTCFGGADHDVTACSQVNRVLIPLDIVCGEVDMKYLS